MDDFHKLEVWERAHELTLAVCRQSGHFPRTSTWYPSAEVHGLTARLCRITASIGRFIADGARRTSHAAAARSLHNALDCAREVVHELQLARDLGLMSSPEFDQLVASVEEIENMLTRVIHGVEEPAECVA